MKRMSDEAYAEQSVATTTEFAAPLEGDSPEVALFRPLLARTRLERAPLRCAHVFLLAVFLKLCRSNGIDLSCRLAFSAAEAGWDAGAFHAAVDTFGAAVQTLCVPD